MHAPNLQFHHHDSNLVENIEVLDEVRRTVERYPDRFVMGEFSEEAERCGCYAAPEEGLHSGYSFPLLEARTLGPDFIRSHFAMLAQYPAHWPSISFSNHDVVRTVSRFGGKEPPPGLGHLMLALLLSLRGTALLYQGEELGLTQVHVRRDQLRDPVGDLYYPYIYGRDGCRTPMPWQDDTDHLGFTSGTPWLPLAEEHRPLSVSAQLREPGSALNFARRFVAARRVSQALRLGDIAFRDAPNSVLAFTRTHGGERILCVFNLGGADVQYHDSALAAAASLGIGCGWAAANGELLALGPYAAEFLRL